MKVSDWQKKYPVTHGRDFGGKMTLGEVLDYLEAALNAEATEESTSDVACDVLDKYFLFGAWGQRWDDRDYDLLRDIRGLVISAYRRGKAKAATTES